MVPPPFMGRNTKPANRKESMDFFKILNTFGALLAWLIVMAVLWAVGPILLKLLALMGGLHHLGQ